MQFELHGRRVYAYTGTKPIVPEQRTVLFIHGAANDHSVWALQSRYFAYHGFNVLAVDLPGHGKSDGPALATIEELAAWTFDVLDTRIARTGGTGRPQHGLADRVAGGGRAARARREAGPDRQLPFR